MSAACFRLTNCDGDVVYSERLDLFGFVGQYITASIQPETIWLVELLAEQGCVPAGGGSFTPIVNLADVELNLSTPCPTVPPENICADAITNVSITETFSSCNDCLQNCYKLTDCLTGEVLYFQGIYLSAYIGKVIKFNRVFPDGYTRLSCFLVEQDECFEDLVEFPFEVLDCFTECEDCLPKCICSSVVNSGTVSKRLAYTDCEGNRTFTAEFVPAGKRSKKYCVLSWDDADAFDELQFGNCEDGQCPVTPQPKKFVAPGYDTPTCTPEQYEKILCNHSEQAYKQVLTDRYGISNCCPEDAIKWEVKYELIKLEALEDPFIECKTKPCNC